MLQPGWSVTVDGKPARLVSADEAMAAVAVPGGTHRVDFVYRAPEQVTGAALSVLGVILVAVLIIWDRRRRSTPMAAPPEAHA